MRRFQVVFGLILICGFVAGLHLVDALFTTRVVPATGAIIRLHVVPNSNQPKDQDLKLLVRDALLPFLHERLGDAATFEATVQTLQSSIPEIEAVAASRLQTVGSDQNVTVTLGPRRFDERLYHGRVVPEGEYISLVVRLGEGNGDNFWCIIFPSLCFVPEDVEIAAKSTAPANVALAAEAKDVSGAGAVRIEYRWRLLDLLLGREVDDGLRDDIRTDEVRQLARSVGAQAFETEAQ